MPNSKLIQPEAEHYVAAPHDWPGNRIIAAVHHVDGVSAEDTARLIASAPELLAALRAIRIDDDTIAGMSEERLRDALYDRDEIARSAIARAEGVRP